jgi:outer membrane murein-binding lipoprotein Lpp
LNGKKSKFIIPPMSEETTHDLPDRRSFEERVFARFDALDAGIRDLNVRVERLEAESQRRAADTKPIWERALAEIAAVRQDVGALTEKVDALDSKVTVLGHDMLTLRADQSRLEKRMNNLESKPLT